MRICFLAAANSINTQSWALSFVESGHEVHIITFHNAQINNVGVHFIGLPSNSKIRYLLGIPKVKTILSQINPDIVIGYYLTSYGLVASIAGVQPLVLAAGGSDINGKFHRSIFDGIVLRYSLKKPALIFSWAKHMRERLIELGAEKEKIVTFPRGIDTRVFYPTKQIDSSKEKSIRVISTRSLRKVYNLPLLMRSVKLAIKQGIKVKCLFLGDGPEKKRLFKLAADLGILAQVKFLGAVEYHEVASYLRKSDIYVSPTLSDGASASLFEAMASGIFPIVSDISANREWIKDGRNGFLVPVDSPEILSHRIINASQNPDLRNSAKEENVKIIHEKASLQINSKRMEDYFAQLVDKPTQPKVW